VYSPKILAITLYEQFQSKVQAFLVFSFECLVLSWKKINQICSTLKAKIRIFKKSLVVL